MIAQSAIESPVKRYIQRLTQAFEKSQTARTLLQKENSKQQALLSKRKERITGKRVALKGRFVFNTQEILDVVHKSEAEASNKGRSKRRKTRAHSLELSRSDLDIQTEIATESDSDCIIVADHRVL